MDSKIEFQHHFDDFMCYCGKDDNDNKKKCDTCLEWAYKNLGCNADNFLTAVIYNLEWGLNEGFKGSIDSMFCDQWAGIGANIYRQKKETYEYEPFAHIFVQCDLLEHGLARVWQFAESIKGE